MKSNNQQTQQNVRWEKNISKHTAQNGQGEVNAQQLWCVIILFIQTNIFFSNIQRTTADGVVQLLISSLIFCFLSVRRVVAGGGVTSASVPSDIMWSLNAAKKTKML